jgi:hypothetical protein
VLKDTNYYIEPFDQVTLLKLMEIKEVREAAREGTRKRIEKDRLEESRRQEEEKAFSGLRSEKDKALYRRLMSDKLSQISTMASSANGENLIGLKKTEKMMAFEEEFKVFLDVENDDVEMVDEK